VLLYAGRAKVIVEAGHGNDQRVVAEHTLPLDLLALVRIDVRGHVHLAPRVVQPRGHLQPTGATADDDDAVQQRAFPVHRVITGTDGRENLAVTFRQTGIHLNGPFGSCSSRRTKHHDFQALFQFLLQRPARRRHFVASVSSGEAAARSAVHEVSAHGHA
jgi:hypothetical protein